MAVWAVKKQSALGRTFVLAPERYDPRRDGITNRISGEKIALVGHVAQIVRKIVTAHTADAAHRYIVLDTSNAQEGIIISPKTVVTGNQIGSAKKVIGRHDVIISRLRPYLRQVAFVDEEVGNWMDDVVLVGSTEFFVLRSVDEHSIAFLVPYLLSLPVQQVLAAAQEGGHHPRVAESTILTLPIPEKLLHLRKELSTTVEAKIRLYREYEQSMANMIGKAGRLFISSDSETANFLNVSALNEILVQ